MKRSEMGQHTSQARKVYCASYQLDLAIKASEVLLRWINCIIWTHTVDNTDNTVIFSGIPEYIKTLHAAACNIQIAEDTCYCEKNHLKNNSLATS